MRLRVEERTGGPHRHRSLLFCVAILAWCGVATLVRAADAPPIPTAPDETPATAGAAMASTGWLEDTIMRLEHEAMSDVSMLPDTPSALAREWRSFDRDGSACFARRGSTVVRPTPQIAREAIAALHPHLAHI